jgi:predicted porin
LKRTALIILLALGGAASASRIGFKGEELLAIVDPFNTGTAGTAKNLFPDWGANIRTSNTIRYASPRVHGADAEAFYSAGEQTEIPAGRQFGGALGYASGPLTLRVADNSKNSDVVGTATAAYEHIPNQNGASYTVANNTESGSGNTGYNLGIRHTF